MTDLEKIQQRRQETAEASENFLFYALIDPRDASVIPALFPAAIHSDKAGCVAPFQGRLVPALYSRFQAFKRQYDNPNPSIENLWMRNCAQAEVVPIVRLVLAADKFPRHSIKALVRAIQTSLYRCTIPTMAVARGVRYPTEEEKTFHEASAQEYVNDFFHKLTRQHRALAANPAALTDLTSIGKPRSVKARLALLLEKFEALAVDHEALKQKVSTNAESSHIMWNDVQRLKEATRINAPTIPSEPTPNTPSL